MPNTGYYIVANFAEENRRRLAAWHESGTGSRLPPKTLEAFGIAPNHRPPKPSPLSDRAICHVQSEERAAVVSRFLQKEIGENPACYVFTLGTRTAESLGGERWVLHDLELDIFRKAILDSDFARQLPAGDAPLFSLFTLAGYCNTRLEGGKEQTEQDDDGKKPSGDSDNGVLKPAAPNTPNVIVLWEGADPGKRNVQLARSRTAYLEANGNVPAALKALKETGFTVARSTFYTHLDALDEADPGWRTSIQMSSEPGNLDGMHKLRTRRKSRGE